MAIDTAAEQRSRGRLAPVPSAPVVDPTRGTRVALAFPLVAALLTAVWLLARPGDARVSHALIVVSLAALAVLAERVSIQLGPRSWYTPTTPIVVLAGILGGPLAGQLVAIAGQVGATDSVWRRRAAGAGLGALQGGLVGVVGLAGASTVRGTVVVTAAAMVVAVLVNSACRWLILIDRRATPRFAVWKRGAIVDLVEAVIATPLLAGLVVLAPIGGGLVVATLGGLLVALVVAERMQESTIAALETEQANARRDILTGAPNRRAFEELLTQQHARVIRGESPAGLFVIDVDRFKAINDRYGHHTGDLVLIEIVRRLQTGLRTTDVVARWGGEELTVLAPAIRSRRGLEQYADRIRLLVSERPFADDQTLIAVTVSVGGTFLDGSLSPTEATARADAAMYEAKRSRDTSVIELPPRLTLHAS